MSLTKVTKIICNFLVHCLKSPSSAAISCNSNSKIPSLILLQSTCNLHEVEPKIYFVQ